MKKNYNDEKQMREISISGECWRQCQDYPDYYVSTEGRVYSTLRHIIMRYDHSNKYLRVELKMKDGKRRKVRVHTLVATAFCPHTDTQTIVHHENSDKCDNRAINLVWVTPFQHKCIHDYLRKLKKEGSENQ